MQQNLRENLSNDMKEFIVDSSWDYQVKETMQDIMEFRTERPLIYCYEKLSVKQKLDPANQMQLLIFDIAISISKLDPIIQTRDQVISAVLKLMIDKYQTMRLKKFDALKCLFLLLQDCPASKEAKEMVVKIFSDKLDENTNSNQFSRMVYASLVFVKALQEVNSLIQALEPKKLSLSALTWFIEEDAEHENTLISQIGLVNVLQGSHGKIKAEDNIQIQNLVQPLINMVIQNYFDM